MSERFIKYIPSEKSEWLREHYPCVFLLLSLAVEQARWCEDILDGLLPGDSILGNFQKAGLSRKQYRTALDKGIELGYWEVVYNQKDKNLLKTPKRAIKRAIKSIVINITNSSIWDLNIPTKGQDVGQRGANTGPTKGHKQRKIKNVKNEKEEQRYAQPAPRLRISDSLSFNFQTFKFEGISEEDITSWKILYPQINLDNELIRASEWIKSNPSRSKRKLWRKFLTGWLGRANENLENKKAFRIASQQTVIDRKTKNMDGTPIKSKAEDLF